MWYSDGGFKGGRVSTGGWNGSDERMKFGPLFFKNFLLMKTPRHNRSSHFLPDHSNKHLLLSPPLFFLFSLPFPPYNLISIFQFLPPPPSPPLWIPFPPGIISSHLIPNKPQSQSPFSSLTPTPPFLLTMRVLLPWVFGRGQVGLCVGGASRHRRLTV